MSETLLFHFSYHKCLTVYYGRVMRRAFTTVGRSGRSTSYRHLSGRKHDLARTIGAARPISVNNHYIEPELLGDNWRASRFIRDPRDLLVSGYHYHKRGAEAWCLVVDPTDEDWRNVNGRVPKGLTPGMSFSSYLQSVDLETGLMAELDFRRAHFDSMLDWSDDDERVLLQRYEDVMQDEVTAFRRIFDHYGIRGPRRWVGLYSARKLSASARSSKTAHIRNPDSGQWRTTLPQSVVDEFTARHGAVLTKYGYPA